MVVLCRDLYVCRKLEDEIEAKLEEISGALWDLVRSLPDTTRLDPEILDWVEAEIMELRADVEHLIEKTRNKGHRIVLFARMGKRGQ